MKFKFKSDVSVPFSFSIGINIKQRKKKVGSKKECFAFFLCFVEKKFAMGPAPRNDVN